LGILSKTKKNLFDKKTFILKKKQCKSIYKTIKNYTIFLFLQNCYKNVNIRQLEEIFVIFFIQIYNNQKNRKEQMHH